MIKPFKFFIWFFILLFWTGSIQAASPANNPAKQAPSQPSPPQDSPVLEIPEATFEFGEVMEGGEVTHDFAVKNIGKGILQIDQVRPG